MELVRDILDKQVVDRNETKMGKVDGIVAELREGAPPRVAFIEIGSVALARRLGPRLGRLVSRLSARLGGEAHREPYRVPWQKVRDIGVDIELDLEVHETTIFDWQDWLRDHVIGKIPGASS
jgi:sporulation protein YlmC with PRC-barrel domain